MAVQVVHFCKKDRRPSYLLNDPSVKSIFSLLPLIPVEHVGTWGLSHSVWAKRRSPVSLAKGPSHTGQTVAGESQVNSTWLR